MLKVKMFDYFPELEDAIGGNIDHLEVTIDQVRDAQKYMYITISDLVKVDKNNISTKINSDDIVLTYIYKNSVKQLIKPNSNVQQSLNTAFSQEVLGKALRLDTSGYPIILMSKVQAVSEEDFFAFIQSKLQYALSEIELDIIDYLDAKGADNKVYIKLEQNDFTLSYKRQAISIDCNLKDITNVHKNGSFNKIESTILHSKIPLTDEMQHVDLSYINKFSKQIGLDAYKYYSNKTDLVSDNNVQVLFAPLPEQYLGITASDVAKNNKIVERVAKILTNKDFAVGVGEYILDHSDASYFIRATLINANKVEYKLLFGGNGIYLSEIKTPETTDKLSQGMFLYKKDSVDEHISSLEAGRANLEQLLGRNMLTRMLLRAYDERVKAGFEG